MEGGVKAIEGSCFGMWDMRDSACSRCVEIVRMKCEETTKRLQAARRIENIEVDEEKQNYNEHFLLLLEGKMERQVQWSENSMSNKFFKDDKLMVFVGCGLVSGKIKIKTNKGDRIVKLESLEQAEALAKEVLNENI